SIDSILERSGGSKATLYSYFPTKDDLFRAVIDEVLASAQHPQLETSADPRTTLIEFSVQRLEVLFSAKHHALLRLIIAERERFPDLAKMYYERAPLRSRAMLTSYFTELERRQVIDAGTAEEADEVLIGQIDHWRVLAALLHCYSTSIASILQRAHRV